MESKLTLKLDTGAIRRAKQFVKTHKGNSLSKLVEGYFNSLTAKELVEEKKLPPIVSSLAGIIKNHRKENLKDTYTDYLIEKYK